jgi:hypothetical protein
VLTTSSPSLMMSRINFDLGDMLSDCGIVSL